MPSPTFVSGSNAHALADTVAVPAPASIASGNLLVAFIYAYSASAFILDTGWTAALSHPLASGGGGCCVATKTAGSSEPATYTLGQTGSSYGVNVSILQFSGAGGLDGSVLFNAMGSTNAPTAPAQTPTKTPDTLVAGFASWQPALANTPAGMTAGPSGVQPTYTSNATFYQYISGTSSTGTISTTYAGTVFQSGISVSFLLAPPAAVTGSAAIGLGPLTVTASPAGHACQRGAWLELGSATVPFEDPAGGWFCSSLDLSFPTVRDVLTNRADNTGATDRTQLFGPRTVTVQIEALTGAGARIDAVAAQFAPFMNPAARPELHYVLDRPGLPERMLTVRAANWSWPVVGAYQRSIQLQFVASDPVCYDPTPHTATATAVTIADFTPLGDLPARPFLTLTGPTTGPAVIFTPATGPAWMIAFLATFTIPAGHHIDIDTAARTVYYDSDPAQPRLSSIDWTVSSWQSLPPGGSTAMALTGSATTGATQVTATWQDGYLT
jgi:hypothetical protein